MDVSVALKYFYFDTFYFHISILVVEFLKWNLAYNQLPRRQADVTLRHFENNVSDDILTLK